MSVSGRGAPDVERDLPPDPLVPLLRTEVDHRDGRVATSLLGAWRSAAWVGAAGCTLSDERPDLPVGAFDRPEASDEGRPAGDGPPDPGDVDLDAIEAALDRTFSEDGAGDATRGTRAVVVAHQGRLVTERYTDGFDADTPLLGCRRSARARAPSWCASCCSTRWGMRPALVEADRTGTPVCSSFPDATARDWARFGQLYLDDGRWDGERLLPEGWVAFCTEPVASADATTPSGAQMWLNVGPEGALRDRRGVLPH